MIIYSAGEAKEQAKLEVIQYVCTRCSYPVMMIDRRLHGAVQDKCPACSQVIKVIQIQNDKNQI